MTECLMNLKACQIKCRCCLGHLQLEDTLTSVDKNIENLFFDLTKIEVN